MELQTRLNRNLPARLFEYYTRLTAQRNREVVTLVLLTGSPRARQSTLRFRRERLGCVCALEFPVLRVAQLAERRAELTTSLNRFARVAMAHLEAMATSRDDQARLAAKTRLTLALSDAGYPVSEAQRLYQFFDWLLRLPKPLERQFVAEIRRHEEVKPMPWVTSIELIAREEGLEQGIEQGLERGRRASIGEILRARFPNDAESAVIELEKVLAVPALTRLVTLAVQAKSVDEVRQAIRMAQSVNGSG